MPNFKKTQNNFSAGEISPDFFSRNIPSAVSKLENIFVTPTGVLSRRPGSIRIDYVDNVDSIIIPFGNDYLLVLSQLTLLIYKDNSLLQSFLLNWNISDIHQIQWVQRFDTMIFVHPDSAPKVLQKSGNSFLFSAFIFDRDSDNFPIMPFMRFTETENTTLTLSTHSSGTNWANVTASAAIWESSNVGGFLMMLGKKWQIQTYTSATQIAISTVNSFTMPTAAVSDWKEAAFSDRRGWPRSITFHQDRLVFGGSRDWPCGLWLSKTGKHHNFDVGTGLDDESIFVTLLSETQQKICTCISSRDLQILTDSGEWAISSTPLTPSTINIRQYTSIGTLPTRFVPPQKLNGSTIFVSNKNICEFALDELGENYNANDLILMAKHLMNSPTSMSYNAKTCQLFVVMSDGTMAVFTKQSSMEISAWCKYVTTGEYKNVASQNGNVYTIAVRDETPYLEMFSDDARNDSNEYEFEWTAHGMPLMIENHTPKKIRTSHVSAQIADTQSITISNIDFNYAEPFSGDVTANLLGWNSTTSNPLWTISGKNQLPAKILSVTTDGEYEI